MSFFVNVLVEGNVDEAVALKICENEKISISHVYGHRGKSYIDDRLKGLNDNVKDFPWLVLRDMDHDADCAPALVSCLLSRVSPLMTFRIVVREIEAWLMADRESFSNFFGINENKLPEDPELLEDPKGVLINLARTSRKRVIREYIIPRMGSGAEVGPAYNSTLSEFVRDHWRPDVAARKSDSLGRCLKRLKELKNRK